MFVRLFRIKQVKASKKSSRPKRAWDTCGKTSVRKLKLLYCLLFCTQATILHFFKTITIKILHNDTNRFTFKIELGDDAGNSHLKQQLITE